MKQSVYKIGVLAPMGITSYLHGGKNHTLTTVQIRIR